MRDEDVKLEMEMEKFQDKRIAVRHRLGPGCSRSRLEPA